MKNITLEIGSSEWMKSRSASKATAMMGCSKYMTRNELIRQMATGIKEDVDKHKQALFDSGHASEAAAREIAEDILCDGLSPVSGATDDGYLTASFDGLTFDGDIAWEHKVWNEELAASVRSGIVPDSHAWQLDQQILVGGLSHILFMVSDGTREKYVTTEYRSTPERAEKLLAGWKQFDIDLANYVPAEIKEAPKADVVVDLPALFVHAKGEITTHNMDEFGHALTARLAETRAIVLITDRDFSNAKESAKKFRETAKAIAISKEAMLAQTETIGEAARKMDAWAKDLNATALQLEKDVEREDKAKKEMMVLGGKSAYSEHLAALELEIAPIRLTIAIPNFAEAIKGKRNFASMQDAVDSMLVNSKIEADLAAKDMRSKLAWFKENSVGYSALYPDLQQIINKPMVDFALTITSRIDKSKADEAARMDAERAKIRAEEEAKATAKSKAEQDAAEAKRIEDERKAQAAACITNEQTVSAPPAMFGVSRAELDAPRQQAMNTVARAELGKAPEVVSPRVIEDCATPMSALSRELITLTDAQLWDVIDFVRNLKQKAA